MMPIAEKEKSESTCWACACWTVILAFITFITFLTGCAYCANIIVGPGESIQEAIDKASSGDVIEVMGGIYRENIEVKKRLVLRGRNMPAVQAQSAGSTINVSADGCIVEGFEVSNSSGWKQAGIRVTSDNNIINGNIVRDNELGIYLDSSNGNTLTSNDARTGGIGIFLMYSSNSTINGNSASCNGKRKVKDIAGIWLLDSCNNNLIYGNNLDMSGPLKFGILITESEGNSVIGNTAIGSGWISGFGIALLESEHNTIKNNTAVSNGIFGQGIRLMFSSKNTISNNDLSCYGPMGQAMAIL
jgi:parallel beta-helix repeat protein